MKLFAWNCNGRDYARCSDAIARYLPDIQVLSEVLPFRGLPVRRSAWSGPPPAKNRRKKGVGIVVRDGLSVTALGDCGDPTCLVARVDGLGEPLHVVGVWSRPPYEKPTALALAHARELLGDFPFIAAGDFNSNAYPIWAGKRAFGFPQLIEEVENDCGLSSAYHAFHRVPYGSETHPTFFWYHKRENPFHIDFVFVPKDWTLRLTEVVVPTFEDLEGCSDHRPVIVGLSGH